MSTCQRRPRLTKEQSRKLIEDSDPNVFPDYIDWGEPVGKERFWEDEDQWCYYKPKI